MSGTLDITLVETPDVTLPGGARPCTDPATACFHCGEPCPDSSFAKEDKVFCCHGCLIVHDLLAENGLGQFYDLSLHPGVRVRPNEKQRQWSCLDEPSVAQRLLDFTDGDRSRVTLRIPAIHCVACVWLLENLFRLHPGIRQSQVNFGRREVAISFASKEISLSELVRLLGSIGYEPQLTLDELEKRAPSPIRQRQWLQVGVAGFAFGNTMLFSLPIYLGLDTLSGPLFKTLFAYLSLALAIPVLVYSASDYWRAALLSVRRKMLTLDVPIALGLAALYSQSAYEILSHRGDGYLDSLTGLVFFLLCGRIFQQKTQDRIVFDRDYKSFFPLSIIRKNEAGEEMVALSSLRVGDRLLVRNRELIPADARLISGPAFIDYSFVTGESEPVEKQPADYLYAGGQQIGGAIEIETVKRVSQSYLTSLWNHDAFQKDRDATITTQTDRYSRRFTRIVIAVAIGAGLCWLALGNATRGMKAFTSVLIVACPCALALAAPFTLGTAQRLLARIQVFLRNGRVLESMARIDTIVFDKTGTLTEAAADAVRFYGNGDQVLEGESAVSRISNLLVLDSPQALPTGSRRYSRLETCATFALRNEGKVRAADPLTGIERSWVYSLTRHSTHPHSIRINESLATNRAPETVCSYVETAGCGVEGNVQGHEIWLGSRVWLRASGAVIKELTLPAGHAVYLAIDGKFRGAFVIANKLRAETDRLLARLGKGYELALLSGDNEKERQRFRGLFGEDARLHFNQSPLDKLAFIRSLQDSGKNVMMVGDGLNDAGALKQSDVGIAVVEKIGAFSPASDAIVAAHQVPSLFRVLLLARRAARIVRLSFGISSLYNVAGISIAAAGILSPIICAILMPLSSLSVVLFACGATQWAARKATDPIL